MTRLLLLLLVSGCSVMGNERVEGWPKLRVIEHYVSPHELSASCAPHVPWHSTPLACALFVFARAECHIFYSAESPPPEFVKRHERLHCEGYDHIGSTNMQRLVRRGM